MGESEEDVTKERIRVMQHRWLCRWRKEATRKRSVGNFQKLEGERLQILSWGLQKERLLADTFIFALTHCWALTHKAVK